MTRPHCLEPDACVAKGANSHCRRCCGVLAMRRNQADPAFRSATAERANLKWSAPEARAAQAEKMRQLNRDPAFVAARDARSREFMIAMNKDPQFVRRKTEAVLLWMSVNKARHAAAFAANKQRLDAANAASKAKRDAAFAGDLRIPIQHLREYRTIRGLGFSKEQAIGIIQRGYQKDFQVLREVEVSKFRRVITRDIETNITHRIMGDPQTPAPASRKIAREGARG